MYILRGLTRKTFSSIRPRMFFWTNNKRVEKIKVHFDNQVQMTTGYSMFFIDLDLKLQQLRTYFIHILKLTRKLNQK